MALKVGMVQPEKYFAWRAGGRYLAISALMHLVWEFAHMPLYKVWETGAPAEIAYNGLHCTLGDVMIAASSLLLAVLFFGRGRWPGGSWLPVAGSAVALGIGYTIFSEWHNVFVRKAWTYSELMPLVPPTDIGLSPLLQWLVVPSLALAFTRRQIATGRKKSI